MVDLNIVMFEIKSNNIQFPWWREQNTNLLVQNKLIID